MSGKPTRLSVCNHPFGAEIFKFNDQRRTVFDLELIVSGSHLLEE